MSEFIYEDLMIISKSVIRGLRFSSFLTQVRINPENSKPGTKDGYKDRMIKKRGRLPPSLLFSVGARAGKLSNYQERPPSRVYYLQRKSFPFDTQVALLRHGDGLHTLSFCFLQSGTILTSAQTHSGAWRWRQNRSSVSAGKRGYNTRGCMKLPTVRVKIIALLLKLHLYWLALILMAFIFYNGYRK